MKQQKVETDRRLAGALRVIDCDTSQAGNDQSLRSLDTDDLLSRASEIRSEAEHTRTHTHAR